MTGLLLKSPSKLLNFEGSDFGATGPRDFYEILDYVHHGGRK
jgi:hypothetical protein